MNIPQKFVSQLTDSQITVLENLMEMSPSGRVRMRAHCILLSSKRISIDGIAFIYNIDRDSVSLLIDKWEEREVAGLYDKARPVAPPKLPESEIGIVKELIKEYPDSPKTILGKLYEQIGKSVSMQTLRRIVKKADMRWKRVRKSLKNKRDEEKFEKAGHEIEELKKSICQEKSIFFILTNPVFL
jgi:transposase